MNYFWYDGRDDKNEQLSNKSIMLLAPVVQKVDIAIRWINLYPVDKVIGSPNTYPLASDLSGG